MTVLVLATELDLTADRVILALADRGVPVARVDTAWFPLSASLEAELRAGSWVGTLHAGGRSIDLTGLGSIWYRNPSTFTFPDTLSPTERQWATTESRLGLGGVLAALPVLWVNHPSRSADAAYKPLQLAEAVRCGLTVADTLVTNRPDAVRRFAAVGQTVTKALGSPSIRKDGRREVAFTRRLRPDDLDDLRGLEVAAHQFQRWVPKAHEVRVTVVGERLFAAAIHANSPAAHIDWRSDYTALRYEQVDPPREVAAGINKLMRALRLSYGALDFVVSPSGEWTFLEINPGGQHGWIEDATGLPSPTRWSTCSPKEHHDRHAGHRVAGQRRSPRRPAHRAR